MNRYARARAELEEALVIPERPRSLALVDEPVRYAAFTVMQPWAWLIANSSTWPEHVPGKTIENRSQATGYRGPVLVHVSRRWERVGEQLGELRRLGLVGRGCPEPNVAVMRSQLGMVIAIAELVGCRRVHTSDPHPWATAGSWGWDLEEVELVQPLKLRGQPGLWFAPAGVRVRRYPPKLRLEGLPGSGTGTTPKEVGSYREAIRVLSRHQIWHLDFPLHVNGSPMTAGELWARAAAEHGDEPASRRIRSQIPRGRVVDSCSEGAARGPGLRSCEGGRDA